jgi:aspartate oxidase
MLYTDGQGFFYTGDCRIGDRAATIEEAAARQAAMVTRVPEVVSFGQLVRALSNLGHLVTIKAVVTAAGGLGLELWQHASTFERNDPLLIALATEAGLTTSDVDAVFRLAATL